MPIMRPAWSLSVRPVRRTNPSPLSRAQQRTLHAACCYGEYSDPGPSWMIVCGAAAAAVEPILPTYLPVPAGQRIIHHEPTTGKPGPSEIITHSILPRSSSTQPCPAVMHLKLQALPRRFVLLHQCHNGNELMTAQNSSGVEARQAAPRVPQQWSHCERVYFWGLSRLQTENTRYPVRTPNSNMQRSLLNRIFNGAMRRFSPKTFQSTPKVILDLERVRLLRKSGDGICIFRGVESK